MRCINENITGLTYDQLNGGGRMWVGSPDSPPMFPTVCHPLRFPIGQIPVQPPPPPPASASHSVGAAAQSAPAEAPEQSGASAISQPAAAAQISQPAAPGAPFVVYPYQQSKTWWCPPMYQQFYYPQVPQYPPQYTQYTHVPQYVQYPQYPSYGHPYPQQSFGGAGMVGSSLYGMYGDDPDLGFQAYDHFQLNFT